MHIHYTQCISKWNRVTMVYLFDFHTIICKQYYYPIRTAIRNIYEQHLHLLSSHTGLSNIVQILYKTSILTRCNLLTVAGIIVLRIDTDEKIPRRLNPVRTKITRGFSYPSDRINALFSFHSAVK